MKALAAPPPNSLLLTQLNDVDIHHQDAFELELSDAMFLNQTAATVMAEFLNGFIAHPPKHVTRLMQIRNVLVRPLGLRTSNLGCPVSSLNSKDAGLLFLGKFPVLAKQMSDDEQSAQAILGADDKHLMFRSCVGVRCVNDQTFCFSIGTRVHCKNLFGRFYMSAIDLVHRHYISPLMLKAASAAALQNLRLNAMKKENT